VFTLLAVALLFLGVFAWLYQLLVGWHREIKKHQAMLFEFQEQLHAHDRDLERREKQYIDDLRSLLNH